MKTLTEAILSHDRDKLYEKYYDDLCDFFGSNISSDYLYTGIDYIFETICSHDRTLLQKKLKKYLSTIIDNDISFIDWNKNNMSNGNLKFQLVICNSNDKQLFKQLAADNIFNNILNFYGYYLEGCFMITKNNIKYYNNATVTGIYYRIAPLYSNKVNDMVYNENKGILYHFTLPDNVDSIINNGLRIKNKRTDVIPKRIYLYSSKSNIKNNHDEISSFLKDIFDENTLKNNNIAVFRIQLRNRHNVLIDFYTDDNMLSPQAVYTYNNIPSKYIRYLGETYIGDIVN